MVYLAAATYSIRFCEWYFFLKHICDWLVVKHVNLHGIALVYKGVHKDTFLETKMHYKSWNICYVLPEYIKTIIKWLFPFQILIHWGSVLHIYISESGDGLLPVWHKPLLVGILSQMDHNGFIFRLYCMTEVSPVSMHWRCYSHSLAPSHWFWYFTHLECINEIFWWSIVLVAPFLPLVQRIG